MANNTQFNTIIIGGGASGLASAIAMGGSSVAVFEANSRVGKKLLATGNGKCNLLNSELDLSKYNDKAFVKSTFAKYGYNEILKFFNLIGLVVKADNEGRVYPVSESATSVLDVLRIKAENLGIPFFVNMRVSKIEKNNNRYIITADKGRYTCDNLIFATGSNAGTGINSIELIKDFAKIVPFKPSLVPLCTETKNIKGLTGVRVKCAAELINGDKIKATESGEVLFKDFGLSGIVIFNLSAIYSRLKNKDNSYISLNFLSMTETDVKNMLFERLNLLGDITAEKFFIGLFSKMLAKNIIEYAGLQLNSIVDKGCINKLTDTICNFKIKITGLCDFSMAQVCTGGIDLNDVNPQTLELKNAKGLYVVGEALNIDALCGGYNLAWAWASGLLVGENCRQR